MCKTKTTIAFFLCTFPFEKTFENLVLGVTKSILRENPHVEENILPMKLCIFLCKNLKETFHIYKFTVETNRTNWISVAILSQWRKNQTNATNLTIHLLISKHKCKYLEETCENPHSGEKNTTNVTMHFLIQELKGDMWKSTYTNVQLRQIKQMERM